MQQFLHRFRWLVALVLVTSTPGIAELTEAVVHAAVDDGDVLDGHEADDCGDACGSEGCKTGLFHTCRCNASLLVPPVLAQALPLPHEAPAALAFWMPPTGIRPGHRAPPFRPPSV